MQLYRVVDLVEPDNAGLQTHLVLPGIFPALHVTQDQIARETVAHAVRQATPYLTASRNTKSRPITS